MTKAELIEFLKSFDNDIEIKVGAGHEPDKPAIAEYVNQSERHPAYIVLDPVRQKNG
jgi:hypothetical protein